MAGDPVNFWYQLGTSTVSRSHTGRDIIRLTSASQANQGVFYNVIKTDSNNFNGYFDIQMDSVRESHEAADGMGFFYVRDPPKLGSAMGMHDQFVGLGFIVDTFSNSRTRKVPYLYAYTSDGTKAWNPNHDGADDELARGCQLSMNSLIRVYIQYVDEELHVAVAMNANSPQKWHTCFKVPSVKLPFKGGYFAFAGETGHFFAVHQVYDAVFVDESDHERHHDDFAVHDYADHDEQRHSHPDEHHHQDSSSSANENKKEPPTVPEHNTNPDPKARIHAGNDAHESLSGSLDLQVYEVFNAMSAHLKKLGGKDSEDTRLRLEGVREVTAHLIQEMEKQAAQMKTMIETLRHLKGSAGDLAFTSDKFSTQIKGMHASLKTLREKTDDVADSHDDMHADIVDHHQSIKESGGNGMLVMFLVIQVLLGVGVLFVNKMSSGSRKMGRMV